MIFKLSLVYLLIVLNNLDGTNSDTCYSKSEPKCSDSSRKNQNANHINIILFGATGNLAKKYLWNSLYEVYKDLVHENDEYKFSIYAASRDDKKDGRKFISDFLLNLEKCSTDECHNMKKGFSETIQYTKVVTMQDFLELESKLDENTQSLYGMMGSARSNEIGRLFYLAIPPSAYAKTTKNIYKYLMPKIGHPWVRIVIEKPFGSDLESAESLNTKLLKSFDENQIYRVDHYLGKTVVKEILHFRIINSEQYDPLWNKGHIDRIEVVVKEKDDVAGRTGFYNENGILRDVMQNHMTEMLSLVAMEIPFSGGSNISEIHRLKLNFLKKLRPSFNESRRIITGQYSTYNAEWLAENRGSNEVTDVPTFAASVFYVDDTRWRGVPFVMVSGKKLDEKSSYIRIVFKNSHFCLSERFKHCNSQRQLIFYVGGKLGEFIAVSHGLPVPEFKSSWIQMRNTSALTNMFARPIQEWNAFVPEHSVLPYTKLIKGVIDGARHMFVPSDILYQSWKLWSPLIEASESMQPRKYLGRDKDLERLEFVVLNPSCPNNEPNDGVHFAHDDFKLHYKLDDFNKKV